MSAPWLSVVGIGEDGLDGLSPISRAAVDQAEILVGGERHLAMLPEDGRTRIAWDSPIDKTVQSIKGFAGRKVAVLASGDPMWFGVGATLRRSFDNGALRVLPAPSAFSLAAARLGWALHEVECLTVHGRPLARVRAFAQPAARLLVLSHDGDTPRTIAAMLVDMGFGASRLSALAHLGGGDEGVVAATAAAWGTRRVADLNTVAIDCVADAGTRVLARVPGLPDDAFVHDGQLTKREVRAITLAALAPLPGQHVWDVGAGCGSVAIEWMRAARAATAVAVERDPARADMIADNALALGVPELQIVRGAAPTALSDLAPPDAVFLGGGLTAFGVVDAAWTALKPHGRIVANAVTLEGEGALREARERIGGELVRLEVAHAESLGGFSAWRPKMAVVQWRAEKSAQLRAAKP